MNSSRESRLVPAAILLAGAFLLNPAYAVDPDRGMSQYARDRWGIDEGFPRGPVYAIAQTADGYLWIGTGAGLVRFDGFNFRVMKDDSGALPIDRVPQLAADKDGCLWVGLQNLTILRYCNGAFQNPGYQVRASAFSRTKQGETLIADPQRGAMVFRNGRFQVLAAASGLSRTPVTALAQTPDGDVWMGTREAGLFRFAHGESQPVINRLPDSKINVLFGGGDRSLWIGTDGGLGRWNGSEVTAAGVPASLRGLQILSAIQDRDNNLWVGTNSQGLLRFNSHGVVRMSDGDGVSEPAVTALFEDREGDIWVGSDNRLERLRDSPFVTYSMPEGLPAIGASPLFADSDNRIWFSPSAGGLWWMKDGDRGRLAADGLDQDVIYSIAGAHGELWVGRQRGGLTCFRKEGNAFTAKTYTQAGGLAQNSIFSIGLSRDGSVWAGTLSGGVSKLSAGTFTTYTVSDGLASNTISSIQETRDGAMWFATPVGLTALQNGQWHTYKEGNGLPAANVNCLLEDHSGLLWVGTGAGIAFGDARGFRAPAAVPALLREPVLGIAEDNFGWLWISTLGHVVRVRRDRLMRGTAGEEDMREFVLADGLRSVKGVKRYQSVVQDSLGRIWFSLNRGISSVDPARLAQKSPGPIVHIQSLAADNGNVSLGGPVHIAGGGKRITFGFIGLSLSSPERVRFRYWLDGFDRGWSKPSATPEASYTNLSPGPYVFRVIASNAEGVWSTAEATLRFEADPLFWQTWWFGIAAGLMSVFAVFSIYRIRVRQMTNRLNVIFDERMAERTRLARELHDTLLQTIQGSKMVADDGLEDPADPERAYRALERVSTWLAQAASEGRAALAALRSSTTQRNDLVEAFERAGEDCANKSALAFALSVQGTVRKMHPIVRDEVYRIVYEAIRNACLHSRGSRVDVEVSYARNLAVRVGDDGIGIPEEIVVSGKEGHYGLKGMRERAGQIGARFRLITTASGTEVVLIVPGNIAFSDGGRARRGVLRKIRGLLNRR